MPGDARHFFMCLLQLGSQGSFAVVRLACQNAPAKHLQQALGCFLAAGVFLAPVQHGKHLILTGNPLLQQYFHDARQDEGLGPKHLNFNRRFGGGRGVLSHRGGPVRQERAPLLQDQLAARIRSLSALTWSWLRSTPSYWRCTMARMFSGRLSCRASAYCFLATSSPRSHSSRMATSSRP